jgi:hypothetical protein
MMQTGGEVFALWNSERGPEWGNFYFKHLEDTRDWRILLAALSEHEPSFRYVVIPYHRVVLTYGAAWAGILFWLSWKYRSLLPESRKEG